MLYEASIIAVILFIVFVLLVLGLSFYFARKTKSSSGYFAAGGQIHWAVNGIAFAGDYLSAASFLGICGMIAYDGYDGFLYSIGYLAGWVVALFLVAEPLKRLGKYTFTDALDARFNSRGIQFWAAFSTLVVSLFYLIPQMVGAGALITPLLGFPHWVGVVIVGAIVIFIVATAGMTSTTYVQFIKGGLLIIFSTVLAFYIFNNGLKFPPDNDKQKYHEFITLEMTGTQINNAEWNYVDQKTVNTHTFVKLESNNGIFRWFNVDEKVAREIVTVRIDTVLVDDSLVVQEVKDVKIDSVYMLTEVLSKTTTPDGDLYNGEPKDSARFFQVGHLSKIIMDSTEVTETGPLGPFGFLSAIEKSELVRFKSEKFDDGENKVNVWYEKITPGSEMLTPGLKFKIGKGVTFWEKLNFISLMLALFLGTSALPHILIRYYTVPSQKAARKSTIVAISAIGFFYVLTLFMGLGAAINGVLDVESSNMSGPLLAKAFGIGLFSIISAIAFATILGTVSGLIVASSGAIAHDFIDRFLDKKLEDKAKVKAGRIAAFAVGLVAILLGISFKGMNVSFLVGWAFAVAASANLPAILMLLFWKKTTAKGISWSIVFGIFSALGIILTSPSMWEKYGLDKAAAPHKLDNPAIISFTLALIVLIVVSLLTQKDNANKKDLED
ncbi:MAG: cation acetate symporter [Bacteroidetes bacterium]|nr:cation acetate symporter [Bacteroidota bacterium]